MGGSIAIGIRRALGQFETVTAWTNPLPRLVKAKAFLEGDYRQFEEYIDFYREDRASQGYGPSRHVPSEYGYILVDFVEKRIASAGHYTTLERIGRSEIEYYRGRYRDDLAAVVSLITHQIDPDGDVEIGPLTLETLPLIIWTGGEIYPAEMFTNYRFRFPGWEIVASGCAAEDFRRVYLEVQDLVPLHDSDHEKWQRRFAPSDCHSHHH